jgi:hypothetical protein
VSGYKDPSAVFTPPNSSVKIDPNDPAFRLDAPEPVDQSLPAIYLFSNSRDGDGTAYAMAEDGHVLGVHWCSHWGYMRHDLHDRADRKEACKQHYPGGYRLVVLTEPGSLPPVEVIERNRALGRAAKAAGERS